MEEEYREFTKEELKWIADFKKLMAKKESRNLFMFVGSGSVVIYADRVMTGNSVDGNNTNVMVQTKMECDGGDW